MRTFFVFLLSVVVAGCGGSGGDSRPRLAPSPPADADPGGLWEGSLTYQDQTFEELLGFSTADGRFTLISLETFGPDTFAQYIGMFTVDGDTLDGSGIAFAEQGFRWDRGETVVAFTITGTIDERSMLTGSLQLEGEAAATFDLSFDQAYEDDSNLTFLQGVRYVYNDLMNPVVTFTNQASGEFSAQSASGCASLGQAGIIDAAYNLYTWTVTISNCGLAGSYTGFASRESATDSLVVSISNSQRALLFLLEP